MQPGSLLECIAPVNGKWICQTSKTTTGGPKKGDYVTHDGNDKPGPSGEYIFLAEYGPICMCGCGEPGSYPAKYFREIQPPVEINIEELTEQTIHA